VTYCAKKFVCPFVGPRGTGLYDDAVVVVHDPNRENYETPGLQSCARRAMRGHEAAAVLHTTSGSRGRSRWEIEQAEIEVRKAREEAEVAQQGQRDMATPPAIGAEVASVDYLWRPDFPNRFTVELLTPLEEGAHG
jgi:hypothetical protein